MGWTVRKATVADVPGLARVHVESWRHAYRGIVPDDVLAGLDVTRREQGWSRWVALAPPDAVFVATHDAGPDTAACYAMWASRSANDAMWASRGDHDGTGDSGGYGCGGIVAFSAVCAVREAEDAHPDLPTGELAAIYTHPAALGTGAGHAVHEAGVAALAAAGFRHAVLWVFEDNVRARTFYERHGWSCDGVREEFEIGGARPLEVRYSRALR